MKTLQFTDAETLDTIILDVSEIDEMSCVDIKIFTVKDDLSKDKHFATIRVELCGNGRFDYNIHFSDGTFNKEELENVIEKFIMTETK